MADILFGHCDVPLQIKVHPDKKREAATTIFFCQRVRHNYGLIFRSYQIYFNFLSESRV